MDFHTMNLRPDSQCTRSDYKGIGISASQITGTVKYPQLS